MDLLLLHLLLVLTAFICILISVGCIIHHVFDEDLRGIFKNKRLWILMFVAIVSWGLHIIFGGPL